MDDLKNRYSSESASSWKDVLRLYSKKYGKPKGKRNRWIFRGDKTSSNLQTELEKKFDLNGIRKKDVKRKNEVYIIREFQRKASLYLEHEPEQDDILEWIAIMQHYGAPTRLLDWTYSYFNAVYFALAENEKGLVWSFNASNVNEPKDIEKIFADKGKLLELKKHFNGKADNLKIRILGDKLEDLAIAHYLIEKNESLIYTINPFRLNRRLTVQKGLFLITGDVGKSFASNMKEHFDKAEMPLKKNLFKIEIAPTKEERKNILRHLQNMNITNETLFPDLGGFAKSVGERLAYPEIFPPQVQKGPIG